MKFPCVFCLNLNAQASKYITNINITQMMVGKQ